MFQEPRRNVEFIDGYVRFWLRGFRAVNAAYFAFTRVGEIPNGHYRLFFVSEAFSAGRFRRKFLQSPNLIILRRARSFGTWADRFLCVKGETERANKENCCKVMFEISVSPQHKPPLVDREFVARGNSSSRDCQTLFGLLTTSPQNFEMNWKDHHLFPCIMDRDSESHQNKS